MRKLALVMLATVSALAATPAMADSAYPYQSQQGRTWDRDRDNDGRNDRLEDRAYDQRFDRDRDGRNDRLEDRAYDQRFSGEGRFGERFGYGNGAGSGYSARQYGQWYPGWQHSWYENREILPPHRLIRRVERQGFYGARPMGFSRRGMIRVLAFDAWRRPVALRVDPYTGMILRVRPV